MPELTFRYSLIYDRMLHRISQNGADDEQYFEKRKKECLDAIPALNERLQPLLPDILQKISDALGVPWQNEKLVAYVLPNWHAPVRSMGFSDPLTIVLNKWEENKAVLLSPDMLSYVLTHELCHVIQQPLLKTAYYQDLLNKKGIKNATVRNHLLTFSLLKNVLGQTNYYEITKHHHSSKAYKHALDLVEKLSASKIIAEAQKYLCEIH